MSLSVTLEKLKGKGWGPMSQAGAAAGGDTGTEALGAESWLQTSSAALLRA